MPLASSAKGTLSVGVRRVVGKVADMNLPAKLVMAAVVALVASAGLAAGIYYLAMSPESPGQTASASSPSQAAPAGADTAGARQAVSPTVLPTEAPAEAVVPAGGHGDAPLPPTPVAAHQDPESTTTPGPSRPSASGPSKSPTPNPSDPPVLSPSTDSVTAAASPTPPAAVPTPNDPSTEAGPGEVSTGGDLPAPDPVPQTSGGSSDGQVQFKPDKEELRYPGLSSSLNRLVAAVESGQATAREAARGATIHQDDSVAVTIHLSAKADAVVRFLEDNGGDPRNVGVDYIEAYVPLTLLGTLSQQPGVTRVREIVPPQPAGPSGGPARP